MEHGLHSIIRRRRRPLVEPLPPPPVPDVKSLEEEIKRLTEEKRLAEERAVVAEAEVARLIEEKAKAEKLFKNAQTSSSKVSH